MLSGLRTIILLKQFNHVSLALLGSLVIVFIIIFLIGPASPGLHKMADVKTKVMTISFLLFHMKLVIHFLRIKELCLFCNNYFRHFWYSTISIIFLFKNKMNKKRLNSNKRT
jgi:CDP-diglyceride synthetase